MGMLSYARSFVYCILIAEAAITFSKAEPTQHHILESARACTGSQPLRYACAMQAVGDETPQVPHCQRMHGCLRVRRYKLKLSGSHGSASGVRRL